MDSGDEIKMGVYRGYKGHEYIVYGTALLHGTENDPPQDQARNEIVVYAPVYGVEALHTEPRDVFLERLKPSASSRSKFEFLHELESHPPFKGYKRFGVKPGVYRHYKSEKKEYAVYGLACLVKDKKEHWVVIYRPLYEKLLLTWRTREDFLGFSFLRDFDAVTGRVLANE